MVDLIKARGVIPGVKADVGLVGLPGTDDEKSTQGRTVSNNYDELRPRL